MNPRYALCLLVPLSCAGEPKTLQSPAELPPGAVDSGGPSSGTTDSPPVDIAGTLHVSDALEPFVDTLATELSDAFSLSSVHMLTVSAEGVHVLDETSGSQVFLEATTHSGGVPLDATDQLLILDDSLQVWDGTWLRESPLQALMPVPAESVTGHDDHLWLTGGGQLFHHTEGALSAVTIDGSTDVRMVAAASDSLCAVMAPFLMVLDGFGGELSLVDFQPERLATSMTFDADGYLWLADGSSLLARRAPGGDWGELEADRVIEAVYGNPAADDIWLRTASGPLHHRDGQFSSVDVPTSDWLGVDALGRLGVLSSEGLQRVAVRRAVGVSGLMAGAQLDTTVILDFAPTGADTVSSLEVWVGTQQLTLAPDVGTTALDPVLLAPGNHTLRMAVVGPEGTSITDLPFTTGELPNAEWETDIAPIMEEHCSRCHGDTTAIPLHTAELWRLNIDRILVEVATQDMPLGGPYLSDAELDLLRGWQAGGFQ